MTCTCSSAVYNIALCCIMWEILVMHLSHTDNDLYPDNSIGKGFSVFSSLTHSLNSL